MSNVSPELSMSTRPRGRPRGPSSGPEKLSPEDLAVRMARQALLRALPVDGDIALISRLLADYGELVRAAATAADGFYAVRDLGKRYGLGRKAVERLPIPRHKFGGVVRYSRADVHAFENSCREGELNDGNSS